MKYIKYFESQNFSKKIDWSRLGDSEFPEEQLLEIKDIFQEYIDEYHMVKYDIVSAFAEPYDVGWVSGPAIPENIYYSVGLYGKNIPDNNFACIEVWLDSPDGNFSLGLRKEYRRFLDNRYSLLEKVRGFGYNVIDTYQSYDSTIKIKIGE